MATIVTEEDEAVHNGEVLPILSASAKKMRIDKLLATPLPTYTSTIPGSYIWTKVAFWMCRRVASVQFRTTSTTRATPLSQSGGGAMCCGWHTNGLMDPLGIFLQHPKEFVVGARHDLVTRPLLGWWTRRLAVQPVVRKAELLRGGCTEEEAMHLNGRSLLALANGVAHGFGCVLFPEGTSHSESHMIRFKTGPIRTVLASAALAKANDLELPHLLPVGLHFRCREDFRTDQYVEFGEPIQVTDDLIPEEMVDAVKQGGWVEPPAEVVHSLRDRLQNQLPFQTPNTATWEEHRALHLVAHLHARREGRQLPRWQDEVHAARTVREEWSSEPDAFPPKPIADERMVHAIEAAEILERNQLDGRALNATGTGLKKGRLVKAPMNFVAFLAFLLLLPLSLSSLGLQVLLGRLLGDSTDEGLDARTSYQFLAAFFGSLLIWPIIALLWTGVFWMNAATIFDALHSILPAWSSMTVNGQIMAAIATYFLMFPLFWLSGKSFARAWDAWVDLRSVWKRRTMGREQKERLFHLLEQI